MIHRDSNIIHNLKSLEIYSEKHLKDTLDTLHDIHKNKSKYIVDIYGYEFE